MTPLNCSVNECEWQAEGFYFLMMCPIDSLGCGTGIVGIALSLSGSRVVLTDLGHVLPLASVNAAANCDRYGITDESLRPIVVEHAWGDSASAEDLRQPRPPDLITASGGFS